jgi:hypothetical protein
MEQIDPPRPDEHQEQQRPYGTYVAVVEPEPQRTYVSYMAAVAEKKGRKAPRIPVKSLHWSPKFSFERFDRCKSPDTINQRVEKAFDEFDKRRQAERKYGIESGKKKQLQIRHPLNRPVQTSILSIKTHPIQPGGVPDSASVSVGPSTGARPQAMPVETPATVADGEWATKRAWLLEQAANQSPDEKQAFSTKHKGNALADIVEWMDELTDFKRDGGARRVVELPPYIEEKRSLILATMSVPTRWQILVDTCAEVVLIGTKVPHLKIGPSNVVVKGVGMDLTAAEYAASFYVLREEDGAILECKRAHVIKTIPEDLIVWGWYPMREDNVTAHLTLSRKAELLWIENPDKTRRQGFTLGPMERKLVQITDRVTVLPGSPPSKAVAKESYMEILNVPPETIDGVTAYTARITGPTVDKLPLLPPAPNVAYAMWLQGEPPMESTRAAPIAECPPPAVVCSVVQTNAASWSSNGRVKQVAADRRAAEVSAKAAAKEHDAKRRAPGRVFVNDRDGCAAEMSVPSAQQAAAPTDVMKVETMNEHKKIKTEEKEITAQRAIEATAPQSEVPAQNTQVIEASVQETVLDEDALKEYFVLSVNQALEQEGTQFPLEKLRSKSIEELHKMVIANDKAMVALFVKCFAQDEREAVILENEARMNELSIKELLECAVKVRDFRKRKLQRGVIKRRNGGSVFVDAAGKMNVVWYHKPRVDIPVLEGRTPCLAWQEAVACGFVKRQRREGDSDSEVEGNIKQECANELSGIGTQCAQGSPSRLLWQQALQMSQNEMDVERQTSNRHEDQRIEVGSQQGGALQSGSRRRPKAIPQSVEGEMETKDG